MTYPSSILERVTKRGYNTKETTEEMAKVSSQFAMISPGMSVEEAQEGMISIMRAWRLETSQVKDMISEINTLGKNCPNTQ